MNTWNEADRNPSTLVLASHSAKGHNCTGSRPSQQRLIGGVPVTIRNSELM
jgi:hypothetical protein